MYIQCFIKKVDGSPVFVDYEGVRYIFQKNEFGDAVCFVGNQGHVRRLLKMGPANYDEYTAPPEATVGSTLGSTPIPLGGQQKRPSTNPLPQNLTVDDALTPEPGDLTDGPAAVLEGEKAFTLTAEEQAKIEADRAKVLSGEQGPTPDDQDTAEVPPNRDKPFDGKEDEAPAEAAPVDAENSENLDAEAGKGSGKKLVDWGDEAKDAKIKHFKFMPKDVFRTFIDQHREKIMGWPVEVREALAKKLDNLMPDDDPNIEGFIIDDYLRSGDTSNS